MMGEKLQQLGYQTGQVTGTRVLPSEDNRPRVEVSFQGSGRLLDVDVTSINTIVSVVRSDGTLFGEGQGLLTTSGGEMISWRGSGIGHVVGSGSTVSWRGVVYHHTDAPDLLRLNGVVGVFRNDFDESGKAEGTIFEWK